METYAEAHNVPILNANGRRFYAQFIREAQPHRILELGTAIGYSALLMLSHTQAGAAVTTLELSAERYREAQAYLARSSYAAQVTQLRGNAGELLT
ncbi:O-methyltransferase, partial [Selenomonas sp.]|uniref:O-methyltransferase n=1 Tax=Selenomonas sp. TaxID=2053611 RepID=UPI0039BF125E